MAQRNNADQGIGAAMAQNAMLPPRARIPEHPLCAIGPRSRLTAPLGQKRTLKPTTRPPIATRAEPITARTSPHAHLFAPCVMHQPPDRRTTDLNDCGQNCEQRCVTLGWNRCLERDRALRICQRAEPAATHVAPCAHPSRPLSPPTGHTPVHKTACRPCIMAANH